MAHIAEHFESYALAYARSLLELANERNQAAPIGQELAGLKQIIDGDKTFAIFLSDPAISQPERQQLLDRVFENQLSPLVINFLKVLNGKNRIGQLHEIAGAYQQLLDQQLGIVEVEITVAQKLSDDQLDQVRQRIASALKKEVVLHQYVDESIIGGLIVRIDDKLIDGSVKAQLSSIRQKLLAASLNN